MMMVGVILRYSNTADLVRTLGELIELPQRVNADRVPGVAELPRVARTPTPDEISDIVVAYESGLTLREVGELFGFDRGTISNVVKQAGMPTRYHQRTEVDLDKAELLRIRGLTIAEVARHLGVGRTTLVRARRESR